MRTPPDESPIKECATPGCTNEVQRRGALCPDCRRLRLNTLQRARRQGAPVAPTVAGMPPADVAAIGSTIDDAVAAVEGIQAEYRSDRNIVRGSGGKVFYSAAELDAHFERLIETLRRAQAPIMRWQSVNKP